MPVGKVKLGTLIDHPRKCSSKNQKTSRYLSAWFWLSSRAWTPQAAPSHSGGGSSCHHRPASGTRCASPPQSAPVQSRLESQASGLGTCSWASFTGSHHQPSFGATSKQLALQDYSKSFPDVWHTCLKATDWARGKVMINQIDLLFAPSDLCDIIIMWCSGFRAQAGLVSASTSGWV